MKSPAKLLLLTAGLLVFLITATWVVVREIIDEHPGGALPVRQEAHWSLHPDHPVDPTSHTLFVLVNDIHCASGVPPEDRLFPPDVRESAEEVTITFSAERPSGSAWTCQGHPPVTRMITLKEPIGSRRLLDGWYSPPRPVDEKTQL